VSLGVTEFSVFSRRSNVGKVAEAVREIIAGDAELNVFFGGTGSGHTQVYRTSGLVPDRQVPFCAVRPLQERRELQLNREAEVRLPIAVGVAFDEPRETLDAADQSLEEVFNRIAEVLVANSRLEGTAIGGAGALVEGIDSFEPLDLIPVRAEEASVTLFQDVIVNYRYRADAQTGAVA